FLSFLLSLRRSPSSTLFPYTTLFRSRAVILTGEGKAFVAGADIAAMTQMNTGEAEEFAATGHRVFSEIERFRCPVIAAVNGFALDRKSTRLNSSHVKISYAVFCLKKK